MSSNNGHRSGNNGSRAGHMRACMFPQEIRQSDQTQNQPGKTVIAHISDLHFRADTDFDAWPWSALRADLTSTERIKDSGKVDVLAVTGDLVDAPFTGVFGYRDEAKEALARVCEYLKLLCADLGITPETGLVVVPGNHDYRLSGLLGGKRQPRKFYAQFKDYCRPLLLPSLRLCMLVMDSNVMQRKLDLAAGSVGKDDLVDFGSFIEKVPQGYSDCTKVLLLHHHPMPIASAENSSLFDDPRFTLLKNAGQFMVNMVMARVNLILHGHQHSPGYSKAIFPYDRAKEHMITVAAAGSAGKGTQTYNLVTVTDGGKVDLEQRSMRANNTRYDSEDERTLLSYDEARRMAFEGLAVDAGAKLRAKKFTRLYVIKSGSGDADIHERFEDARAFSGEVAEFPTFVDSQSGFFARPAYNVISPGNQEVNWVWDKEDYAAHGRKARIVFNPPFDERRPTTFESHRKTYNLFHFNQRDREDATDGKWRQEFLEIVMQNAYDLLVLTVCFPEGHLPDNFYRVAHNRKKCPRTEHTFKTCGADPLEQERFDVHFSKFKDARTFVISLEKPLPGYTYWVYWNLPKEEEDELNPYDAGAARDFERQLLQMRNPDGPQHATSREWFDGIRTGIIKTEMWRSLAGTDDMEISLYAYDSAQRGLVCVAASLPGHPDPHKPWGGIVKQGTTLVGASYRRKEPMLYCAALKSQRLGESEYEMRIPGAWREAEKGGDDKYTVVCAVPLVFPIPGGRRVAVLVFASKSDRSRLLHFAPRRQVGAKEGEASMLKNKRDSLLEELIVGRCKKLADALGVSLP